MDPSFIETLPESVDFEAVILRFLDEARWATSVTDINIAAGVAFQTLTEVNG